MSEDPSKAPQEHPSGVSRQAADGSSESASAASLPIAEMPTVMSGRRHGAGAPAPLLDPDTSVRGERLDHFELQEYIGVGGMGTVFRAWDTRLERPVALKVLPREQAGDAETARRFIHEAQAAARLNHENIARVYFVGQARGLQYIAFEFVEGTDVRKLIGQFGRLPVNDVVSSALQITSALKHAAARDVVHRDIKPSNIVVTREGLAKLVDMGLARNFDTQGGLTASGVTMGTFDYLSPEQAHDPRTVDVRSDIYSLGCTLYHMLTGQVPFPEGNALQKMLQHREQPPMDVRRINPEVPAALANIVMRMMRKKPTDRYQGPGELLHDLTHLAGSLGLHATSPEGLIWMEPGSIPVPAWQRHAVWMVPVLGVLLLVVVAGIMTGQGTVPSGDRQARAGSAPQPNEIRQAPTGDRVSEPSTARGDNAGQPSSTGGQPSPASAQENSSRETAASGPRETEPLPDPREPAEDARSETDTSRAKRQPQEDRQPTATAVAGESGHSGAARIGATGQHAEARLQVVRRPEKRAARTGANSATPERSPSSVPVTPEAATAPIGETGGPMRPSATNNLVVDPNGGDATYATLRAAVAQAMDGGGNVIELHYDGARQEGPIRVSGLQRLTIRAGEGFRPTLVFDAGTVGTGDQARFLHFIDGTLDLIGLHLVLNVPDANVADEWVLVSVRDAKRLHLQDCILTIRNPQRRSATFIEGRWSWTDEQAMGMEQPSGLDPTEWEIETSMFRGDADVLSLRQPKDVRITLGDNNLIATNQRVLAIEGQRMHSPTIEVEMVHVTARADEGLMLVEAAAGAKPQVKIRAEDNILVLAGHSPLIKHVGELPVTDLRESFQWAGHSNFYEGIETFWTIESTNPPEMALEPTADEFDYENWRNYWDVDQESKPQFGVVKWKSPSDGLVPTWSASSAQFELSDDENRARGGAGDGKDAGADLSLIPRPAATPLAESPPP